jgi:hypothetical protein
MNRVSSVLASTARTGLRLPRIARHRAAHAVHETARLSRVARGSRLLLSLAVPAVCVVALSGGAAFAYWMTTNSANPAAAAAATLSAPTGGTQTGATPGSVTISWTAPAGYTPTSYTVSRCTGDSCTPSTAITSGGCSGEILATSCTDTDGDLAPGQTYTYAVTAVLDNWTSPPSATFEGTTTGASALLFTVQPGTGANIQATGTGSFTVTVAITDSNGNTVTSDNSDDVTLAIDNNPSGGVLSCTNPGDLTVQVVAGLAHFTGCSITVAGDGYTLTASSNASGPLSAPDNANSFNIVAGDPSQLTFTSAPVSGQAASNADLGPISVELLDQNGNVATAGAGGVTVNLASTSTGTNGFATTSGGELVTSVTIGSGQSSASFYYGDELAGTPTITASSTGLGQAMQTETITAGPAAGLRFSDVVTNSGAATVTCTGTVGSAGFACTISPQSGGGPDRVMTAYVTLIDQFQNPTTSSSAVSVTVSQTGGLVVAPASPLTLTIPAGSSTSTNDFAETLVPETTIEGTVTATATVNSATVQAQITS